MRIAFTTKGKDWDSMMDERFGRTEYILVYDDEKDTMEVIDNTDVVNDAHGAGPKTSERLFKLNPDVLITGNGPGGQAAKVLEQTKISVYVGAGDMTVKEAYEAYKTNKLHKF